MAGIKKRNKIGVNSKKGEKLPNSELSKLKGLLKNQRRRAVKRR
tara:strand:+ start:677 stop:808 length:132 start_codon:yes stop_codon:yes gene_type:complete